MARSPSRNLVPWCKRFGVADKSLYDTIYLFQVLPKADASKLEAHVFKVYDANNDGVIDFKEFLVMWHFCFS